jgi:hypothetical protein
MRFTTSNVAQGGTGAAALQNTNCLDSPRSDAGSAVTDSSNRSATDSSNGCGANMVPQEDLLKLRSKYDKLKCDTRELKMAYIQSQEKIDALQQASTGSSTTTSTTAAGVSGGSSGQQQDVAAQLRQQVQQLEAQLLAYQTAAAAAGSDNGEWHVTLYRIQYCYTVLVLLIALLKEQDSDSASAVCTYTPHIYSSRMILL